MSKRDKKAAKRGDPKAIARMARKHRWQDLELRNSA